jgi:DNA-binding CsgD family transcriptional regulator
MPEMADELLEIQDMATQADWLTSIAVFNSSNLESTCRKLDVPTLVTSIDIPGSPMNQTEEAKAMAALIPNASLVILRGTYVPSLVSAIGDFVGRLPSDEEQSRIQDTMPAGLSFREVEVLRLIAVGKSNRQIADALVISLNTVQNHVSNILAKTDLTNRTEAASYARDHGLLPPVPPT